MQTCQGAKLAAVTCEGYRKCSATLRVVNAHQANRFRAGPLVAKKSPAYLRKQLACTLCAAQRSDNGAQLVPAQRAAVTEKEGPSEDFKVIWGRLWKVGRHVTAVQQHQYKLQWSHAHAADFALLD